MSQDIDQITQREFLESRGVTDWRVVGDGACAYFHTGSFAAGARFLDSISQLDGLSPRRPDVDVRYDGVVVRLVTNSPGYYGLTRRDLDLAHEISDLARGLGLRAEPQRLQNIQVNIDAMVPAEVLPFWRAVLGYRDREDTDTDLIDPLARGPLTYFRQMDQPRPQRNRIHIDVWVPHDQAERRVSDAIAAGGELLTDAYAPAWWVLADDEGNEACVCTWQDHS